MSPESGQMLVQQIAPRLRAAIPRCVQPIGAEDPEELVQDAIVVAAQMLHRVEVAGKTVTAGNIAYYAILQMKAGTRSNGRRQVDAMAPGTQLDRKSSVISLEEEVGYDPELDQPITLGELLEGTAQGRVGADDITVADLTGVGIQDAAIAALVMREAGRAQAAQLEVREA